MSGMRGAARSGKVKIKAVIRFADTGRTVRTNCFISVYDDALAVVERIEAKYGKALEVLSVKTKCGYALFAAPEKIAA